MTLVGPAAALALGAALLFGLALVLTQFGLRHLSANHGASISIPTATVLLWLTAPASIEWGEWSAPAAAIFAAVGLLFPAAVTLLTFESNRRMGPSATGAFGNLAPLFAVVVAAAVLGEAVRPSQAFGTAAVIVGAVLSSADRRWLDRRWPLAAIALPLAAAAIRGLVQPVTKIGLALWPSPLAAALIGYTVSSIVVGAVAASRGRWPVAWPWRGAGWFAAVGLCNGLAAVALYAALARGPVSVVAPLVAVYPLVTLLLSAVLLGRDRIGALQAAGVATMVAGVLVLIAA